VDAMVAVHTKACEIPDDTFGQLPLHIACKFRASTEVLKCILDSFPEATRLADTVEGRLPLHYACVDGYPFDISMLIAAGKRALTCKDASGKTPVDLVKESTSPHKAQVIKRILKVAKDDIKNSKRREAKEQQAPDTLLEPHPLDESMLAESLSELSDTTQVASNVRKMKKPTKKAKPILPSRVCRRKAKIDVDQSPVCRSQRRNRNPLQASQEQATRRIAAGRTWYLTWYRMRWK
jgi:Ankyrin repeats (3 copies)